MTFDAASEPLTDPLTGTQITNIEWMAEDALPFPFCLSGFTDEEHGAQFRDDLSIAHGNIVLADHGLTIAGESLGEVPAPQILLPPDPGADRCHRPPPQFARPRFRPSLQAQAADAIVAPTMRPLPGFRQSGCRSRKARCPTISLESTLGADSATWQPQRDLLGSAPDATEFVVEIENDRHRFDPLRR